jgi:hypothetical protein
MKDMSKALPLHQLWVTTITQFVFISQVYQPQCTMHAPDVGQPLFVSTRPPHLKQIIYKNHGRFLPSMHYRYQLSMKGVPTNVHVNEVVEGDVSAS